jgi:hypothetical protein
MNRVADLPARVSALDLGPHNDRTSLENRMTEPI